MSKPHEVELRALENAGALLSFAAENAKEIRENVVSTIALSWEASDNDKWSPEISAKFWVAYNSLCSTIKPMSLDTISCNEPELSPPLWQFWRKGVKTSLSKNTARNYLNILVLGLLISILLQFVVSTGANLTVEIDKILSTNDQIVEKIAQEIPAIRGGIGSKEFSDASLTPDQHKIVSTITDEFEQVWFGEDRIDTKMRLLSFLTSFGFIYSSYNPGTLIPYTSIDGPNKGLINYYDLRRFFISAEEKGSLIIKVTNSTILTLLLGVVGACAYVTRLVSDEIKETTFSNTSPVRHLVRVALGGLAGVIVGFGWIGSGISTSPLALAFIAGYAIEPVFATVDSIAEKFRKSA